MLIAQISDTHIQENKQNALFNVNPAQNLSAVLSHISNLTLKPDYLILTGDISDDKSVGSYQIVSNLIKDTKIKTLFIPGNHDDQSLMDKIFSDEIWINTKCFKLDGWLLILLDSCFDGEEFGLISDKELLFLDAMLKTRENNYCIFIHH